MQTRHPLFLLPPAKLDDATTLSSDLVIQAARMFLKVVPPAPSEKVSYHEWMNRLSDHFEPIADLLAPFFVDLADKAVATGFNSKQADYDTHFRVVRISGNSADVSVASNILTLCAFFKDTRQGSSLVASELFTLLATVQSFVARFIREGEAP